MKRGGQGSGAKGQGRDRSGQDERAAAFPVAESSQPADAARPGDLVSETIPLIDERLDVIGKREVETARVRVSKRVIDREEVIDAALRRDDVLIERVRCDRVVDQASPIRTEGDVTIVPVYEEVLIKQLVLREELRITRRSTIKQCDSGPVVLRSEQVKVRRTPIADRKGPGSSR
jgi:uncharacterized protein (TIGR02271 family)